MRLPGERVDSEGARRAEAANVAVISHAFWQREFGGDPGVLGRTVSLDGYVVPVIGVTPASFFGVEVGSRYDVAVPLCADFRADDPQFHRPAESRIAAVVLSAR